MSGLHPEGRNDEEDLSRRLRLRPAAAGLKGSNAHPAWPWPHANAIAPAMSARPAQHGRHVRPIVTAPADETPIRATRLSLSEVEPGRGEAAGR